MHSQGTMNPTTYRTRRAFTLIELGVVVLIVLLFAALVVPSIVRDKEALEHREAYNKAYQLALRARVEAISSGLPHQLSFDDGESTLKVDRMDQPSTTSTTGQIQPTATLDEEQATMVASVRFPNGVSVGSVRLGTNETSVSEWKLRFYPDGTTDGGGAELNEGNQTKLLKIEKDGRVTLNDGHFGDPLEDLWQAGDYDRRTQ